MIYKKNCTFATYYLSMDIKHKRNLTIAGCLAAVIIASFLIVTYYIFGRPINPNTDASVRIYVTENTTQSQVVEMLSAKDCFTQGFKCMMHMYKASDLKFPVGSYSITNQNARDTYNMFAGGTQTPVELTIMSCRTIEQMSNMIARQLHIDSATVDSSLRSKGPEVYATILPNTYQVYWNISIDNLYKRFVNESIYFWNQERTDKAAAIKLTPVQVVTLASIVQEESSNKNEWPIIAGLYINRLKKGIRLQADPTVLFAVSGPRPKRVLKQHLQIDSPYNTYKYRGLPPGPIRFVNPAIIDAVLDYTHHDYIYMCASSKFDGTHVFTSSLEQHNLNAKNYQRAYRKRFSTQK